MSKPTKNRSNATPKTIKKPQRDRVYVSRSTITTMKEARENDLQALIKLTKENNRLKELLSPKEAVVKKDTVISPRFNTISERMNETLSAINNSMYGIGSHMVHLSSPNEPLMEDETEKSTEESFAGFLVTSCDRLDRVSRTLDRFKNHLDTTL